VTKPNASQLGNRVGDGGRNERRRHLADADGLPSEGTSRTWIFGRSLIRITV
jgi:hypothetical protein